MSEQKKAKIVACPHCQAPVTWGPESRYRPFCSERCRMIDLGAWATDSYRVPAVEQSIETDDEAPR